MIGKNGYISAHDTQIIDAWSAGCQSASGKRSYKRYAKWFLTTVDKPLVEVKAEDIIAFFDRFTTGAISSRCCALSAIKSLFSYMNRIGLIEINPGLAVKIPHERYNTVRCVTNISDIDKMLMIADDERNAAILRVAYSGGLMVSELAGLRWSDAVAHEDGSVTLLVSGYRSKLRHVVLSQQCWSYVSVLRSDASVNGPIFVSKKGGHMSPSAIHRVVKRAALQAGLSGDLSTYWLRHAQAAHSMSCGMTLDTLQVVLGHTKIDTTRRYVSKLSES